MNPRDHEAMSQPGSLPLFPSTTDGLRQQQQVLVADHVASLRPRRGRPGVILGVLGAISALATVLLGVSLGGPWSPEEAVLDYADAMADGDLEDAWELLCHEQHERYDSSLISFMASNSYVPGEGPSVGGVEIADDATWDERRDAFVVPTRSTWPAEPFEADFLVVKEDGHFRVCGALLPAGQ